MLMIMASLLNKLKPTRHWMRFSVRTGLLLVTLLCIALGTWVVPAERQRRAVIAIQALGGLVVHKEDGASKKSFARRVLGRVLPLDYIDGVEVVLYSLTSRRFPTTVLLSYAPWRPWKFFGSMTRTLPMLG